MSNKNKRSSELRRRRHAKKQRVKMRVKEALAKSSKR